LNIKNKTLEHRIIIEKTDENSLLSPSMLSAILSQSQANPRSLLTNITKDIIRYHLFPLLDDFAAIRFILSSHNTYNQ
jgi:hypothetical protein